MKSVRLVTFVVAFCSIVYELLLSEISATLLGGTFYRYILTIGLYIFCLGIGSIYYERIKFKDNARSLFYVELALSLLGLMAPLIPLLVEIGASGMSEHLHKQAVVGSVYLLIIYIGLLSGLELPLLMAIGEKQEEGQSIRILAIDFFATFAGILVFPLVLMKFTGLFNSAIVVGLLNLAIFVFIGRQLNPLPKRSLIIGVALALLLVCANIFGAPLLVDRVFG